MKLRSPPTEVRSVSNEGILGGPAGLLNFRATFLAAIILVSMPTSAVTATQNVCDLAAQVVAAEEGVPASILTAIALTETGRKKQGRFQSWPWTVNMEGAGHWFEDIDAAQAFVFQHYKSGSRSFDIGCFQLNFKWHGDAFSSMEEMFNPIENARYAAQFLKSLFDEFGDWDTAAGAYHSRTPELAEKYQARLKQSHAFLENSVPASPIEDPSFNVAANPVQVSRTNQFPLLQGRIGGTTIGSLVPLIPNSENRRIVDVQGGS